jgi:multimeric flavodoxin WrbA
MHAADGVIFATPVYVMNVSALMKTFIDHFSYIYHRPRFFDKKALLLSTILFTMLSAGSPNR